jgi:hypothetical protein
MAWWPNKKVYLSNVLNKLVPMVWHVIKSFYIITWGDIHDVERKKITTWNATWITSCDVRHDLMWHGIIIIIIISPQTQWCKNHAKSIPYVIGKFFVKIINNNIIIWYWFGMIFAPLGLWREELLVCKHAKFLETKSFKN